MLILVADRTIDYTVIGINKDRRRIVIVSDVLGKFTSVSDEIFIAYPVVMIDVDVNNKKIFFYHRMYSLIIKCKFDHTVTIATVSAVQEYIYIFVSLFDKFINVYIFCNY